MSSTAADPIPVFPIGNEHRFVPPHAAQVFPSPHMKQRPGLWTIFGIESVFNLNTVEP
jgi:hypothetical protein